MREFNTEKVILDAINDAKVGKKINLNFSGMQCIIDIEMTFKGGWVIRQEIIPGKSFEFTKGEEGYLENIVITINEYDGLKEL